MGDKSTNIGNETMFAKESGTSTMRLYVVHWLKGGWKNGKEEHEGERLLKQVETSRNKIEENEGGRTTGRRDNLEKRS